MSRYLGPIVLAALVASGALAEQGEACGASGPCDAAAMREKPTMTGTIATPASPARVPIPAAESAATAAQPGFVVVTLAAPRGVAEPTDIVARIDLLILDGTGATARQVRLGAESFFGVAAGGTTRSAYDLTGKGLDAGDMTALAAGRAAVQVTISSGTMHLPEASVAVLGAALMAMPP